MQEILRVIQLTPGTELNTGFHEDSDPYVIVKPTNFGIIQEETHGALPGVIIEEGEIRFDMTLYYHQPVDRKMP